MGTASPDRAYERIALIRVFKDFDRMWPPAKTALLFITADRLSANRELVLACKAWDWLWAADACWHPNLLADEIEHARELFYEAAALEGRYPRTGPPIPRWGVSERPGS